MDVSKNLVQQGKIWTGFFSDYSPGIYEYNMSGYPAGYFVLLGVWQSVFGYTVESGRLLSMLCGILLLLMIFKLISGLTGNRNIALILTVILSLDPVFIRAAHIMRMEIFISVFIASVIMLTDSYTRKPDLYKIIAAVFLCFLSAQFHPVGYIAFLAGYLQLILARKISWKISGLFIFSGLISVFVWQLTAGQNIKSASDFLAFQLNRKLSITPYITLQLRNTYYKYFFWLSLGSLGILFMAARKKISNKNIYFAVLLIFLFLAVAYLYKEMWYVLYFHIGVSVIFGMCTAHLITTGKISRYAGYFIITGYLSLILLLFEEYGVALKLDYGLYADEIRDIIPVNSKVVVMALPDPIQILNQSGNYIFREFVYDDLNREKYFQSLQSVQYVIINISESRYLAEYAKINAEKISLTGDRSGYRVAVVKLTPPEKRIKPAL
jgi:hypothetical protein